MKRQAKNNKDYSSLKLHPTKLALTATILTATTSLFATILNLIIPDITTITPLLQALYSPLGYSISLTGAILGTLYIGIDTFILMWLFSWLYNKLL